MKIPQIEITRKTRKVMNKIVIILMWVAMPMIILGSILLLIELLGAKIDIMKQLIAVFAIIAMFIFVIILFLLSTKYRKEMLLNDTERKEKWMFLRKDYRNFQKKMLIFGEIFDIFMIISGIFLLFNPNEDKFYAIFMLVVGASLLVSTLRAINEHKEMERKNEYST